MMNIFGFHDIPPKHTAIIVVAALQIVFGIVTLICNEDIFNKLLDKVIIKTFLSYRHIVNGFHFLAIGCKGGNEDIRRLEGVSGPCLHKVLLLQHA